MKQRWKKGGTRRINISVDYDDWERLAALKAILDIPSFALLIKELLKDRFK